MAKRTRRRVKKGRSTRHSRARTMKSRRKPRRTRRLTRRTRRLIGGGSLALQPQEDESADTNAASADTNAASADTNAASDDSPNVFGSPQGPQGPQSPQSPHTAEKTAMDREAQPRTRPPALKKPLSQQSLTLKPSSPQSLTLQPSSQPPLTLQPRTQPPALKPPALKRQYNPANEAEMLKIRERFDKLKRLECLPGSGINHSKSEHLVHFISKKNEEHADAALCIKLNKYLSDAGVHGPPIYCNQPCSNVHTTHTTPPSHLEKARQNWKESASKKKHTREMDDLIQGRLKQSVNSIG
jgi:hypothetical protein